RVLETLGELVDRGQLLGVRHGPPLTFSVNWGRREGPANTNTPAADAPGRAARWPARAGRPRARTPAGVLGSPARAARSRGAFGYQAGQPGNGRRSLAAVSVYAFLDNR